MGWWSLGEPFVRRDMNDEFTWAVAPIGLKATNRGFSRFSCGKFSGGKFSRGKLQ